ncbi:hypothetical protein GW17_00044586, partial [Ensete ventricosum]
RRAFAGGGCRPYLCQVGCTTIGALRITGVVSLRLVGCFGRGEAETVALLLYKAPLPRPALAELMELPVSANKPEHHDLPHQPASPSQFPGSRINVFAVVGLVFLTIYFLDSAHRSRHDPSALAFLGFVYSDSVMLFVCLRNFEKLGADCSPEKKERAKAKVWAVASALNLALAWRAAQIMPPMLAVVVRLMAGLVTLGGFYGLFIYRDADDIVAAHDCSLAKNKQVPSPEEQV